MSPRVRVRMDVDGSLGDVIVQFERRKFFSYTQYEMAS